MLNNKGAAPDWKAAGSIAASIASMSAFFGVTYNVAFFLGAKSEWLFFLSVADNLTATLYALPIAVGLTLLMSFSAIQARVMERDDPARWSAPWWRVLVFNLLMAAVLVGYLINVAYHAAPGDRFRAVQWPLLGLAIAYCPALAVRIIRGTRWQWLPSSLQTWTVLGLVMLPVTLGIVAFAQLQRQQIASGRGSVEVRFADHSAISGSLVRALEGGIIISRDNAWTWVPRSEIKRVVEID